MPAGRRGGDHRSEVKIRISHPHLADQLVESLNATDCLAALTGADAVDVFVPWLEEGDDPAHASQELLFFVKAWGLRYPDFEAQLL
jgi:hypothetical protein